MICANDQPDETKPVPTDSSQIYDNCQLANIFSLDTSDTQMPDECPYSNLSAENFHIKDSPKQGYLLLREKRILFDQWRKVYAVLMGRWLLIYNDGMCDAKPSTCICIDCVVGPVKKGETKFTILSTAGKRYALQVATSDDAEDWHKKIQLEFPRGHKVGTNGAQRRLPSPPMVEVNGHRVSQKSDDIYEEPKPMEPKLLRAKSVAKAPHLPEKQKKYWKRGSQTATKLHYDVPKKLKTADLLPTTSHPTQQLATLEEPTLSVTKPESDVAPVKQEIVLVKQEKMSAKSKRKSGANQDGGTETSPSKTPVKSWILSRLGRSGEKVKKTENQPMKSKSASPPPVTANVISGPLEKSTATAKGGKVNQIIHQLEANGHLQLLSKSLKEKRRSYYAENGLRDGGGGGDTGGQSYESIVMKNIGMI
jgi:PH domain